MIVVFREAAYLSLNVGALSSKSTERGESILGLRR